MTPVKRASEVTHGKHGRSPESGMFAQRGKLCISSNWLGRAETPFSEVYCFFVSFFKCIFRESAGGHEVCLLLSVVPESQLTLSTGGIFGFKGIWTPRLLVQPNHVYGAPFRGKMNCCISTAHCVYIKRVKLMHLRRIYLLIGKKKFLFLFYFCCFKIHKSYMRQNQDPTLRFESNCGERE